MKKSVTFVIVVSILIATGVFAETITNSEISTEVSGYIKSFIEEEGIQEQQIQNITAVDPNNLPDNIDIKKIEKNNIGIYEVNYTESNETKNVYVVTYSTNRLKETAGYIIRNIQTLVFGYPGNSSLSDYLYISAGVKSSEKIGYVMMHEGSITGVSTSLEIIGGNGTIKIKVYKNGEDTGFENLISSEDKKKIDYDTQSERVLTYKPGDIISVYLEKTGDIIWENAIVSVEAIS